MTARTDFAEDEWTRLGRAPLVAAMAITLADPGGPIEAIKESSAAIQTVLEAAQEGRYGDFVQALAKDVAEKAQHRQNPMAGFKPKGTEATAQVLDELRAVNALLVEKTTPEETAQVREWLKTAAQRAAIAAKEGGFLGFNAERVSEGEQQMLDRLAQVFSTPDRSTTPPARGGAGGHHPAGARFTRGEDNLTPPAGFEPASVGLEGRRSVH